MIVEATHVTEAWFKRIVIRAEPHIRPKGDEKRDNCEYILFAFVRCSLRSLLPAERQIHKREDRDFEWNHGSNHGLKKDRAHLWYPNKEPGIQTAACSKQRRKYDRSRDTPRWDSTIPIIGPTLPSETPSRVGKLGNKIDDKQRTGSNAWSRLEDPCSFWLPASQANRIRIGIQKPLHWQILLKRYKGLGSSREFFRQAKLMSAVS